MCISYLLAEKMAETRLAILFQSEFCLPYSICYKIFTHAEKARASFYIKAFFVLGLPLKWAFGGFSYMWPISSAG